MLFEILGIIVLAVIVYWFLWSQVAIPILDKTPSFPAFRKSSRARKAIVEETTQAVATLREEVVATEQLVSLEETRKALESKKAELTQAKE